MSVNGIACRGPEKCDVNPGNCVLRREYLAKILKSCPFCGGEACKSTGQMGGGKPFKYIEWLSCEATAIPQMWNERVV